MCDNDVVTLITRQYIDMRLYGKPVLIKYIFILSVTMMDLLGKDRHLRHNKTNWKKIIN